MNQIRGCVFCKHHKFGIRRCNDGRDQVYAQWWEDNKNSKFSNPTLNDPSCFEDRSTPSEVSGYKLSEIINI